MIAEGYSMDCYCEKCGRYVEFAGSTKADRGQQRKI